MNVYYEDYRLKIVENQDGKYDIYDSKYGGRATHKNKTREEVDNKIKKILNKRNRRYTHE